VAGDGQVHGEACRAGALHEEGRGAGRLVGAQHLEGGAQFAHGLAAGLLDGEQGRGYVLAALAREVDGDARLELDDRDAVGERVVQLPGDPQAFLARPAQGGFLAGAFGLQGALFGLAQIRLPVASGEAGDDRAQEPAREQGGPLDRVLCRGARREISPEEHGTRDRAHASMPRLGRRVDGGHHREGRQGAGVGVQHIAGQGGRGDGEDRAGCLAVRGQRERTGHHQRVVDRRGVLVEGRRGHDDGADHDGERRVGEPPECGLVPVHVRTVDRRTDRGVSPVDGPTTTPGAVVRRARRSRRRTANCLRPYDARRHPREPGFFS
jgi:hypothetical protein